MKNKDKNALTGTLIESPSLRETVFLKNEFKSVSFCISVVPAIGWDSHISSCILAGETRVGVGQIQ